MKTSISDTTKYREVCRLAYEDDTIFGGFKNEDTYIEILEHTSDEQGAKYFSEIKKDNPQLLQGDDISKALVNDMVGNPRKGMYGDMYMSPSTLRYLKILSDLMKQHGTLDGMDIIEIGVGYGGQCLIISNFFDIKSYTLVDLKEVLNLSEKYLDYFNLDKNFNFYTQDELPDKEYDIVISNYAFSECTKDTQKLYIDKILNKSKHGYMINNEISHIFNIESYNKMELRSLVNKDTKILEEIPLTHKDNYLMVW